MKLLILSDLHLEFGIFNVPKVDYDVVILAGDIFVPGSKAMRWARRADIFGETVPIVFVPGNHEFYSGVLQTTQKEMALTAAACKVHLLAPGEAVIDGIRFLGCTLWTDFELPIQAKSGSTVNTERAMNVAKLQLNDYSSIRWAETPEPVDQPKAHVRPKKRRLTPEDTRALHQRDRAWLAQKLAEPFDGPTVVVTHHAPHRGSLASHYQANWLSGAFVSELPGSFFDVPSLWIHGHIHESFDYDVGNCRVLCNPRGYLQYGRGLENQRFNPGLVVDL
ncbi:metallophosphoesterase [Variovorax paradoxus]|uniref:metallophosphoesterase n=1 Tax=Variovorax paradoxus TaxID=34073 RepID=UPI0028552713|nr:metallophosphoesterase [Variovorax paradoxus]MDR6453464.1 Icc-related predicted phosphoesterase [Variovorax paradoxus]